MTLPLEREAIMPRIEYVQEDFPKTYNQPESLDSFEEGIEQESMRKVTDLFRDPFLALHAASVENIPKIAQQGIISSEFAKRATARGIPLEVKPNEPITQEKYGQNLISSVGNLYRKQTSSPDSILLSFRDADDPREKSIFEILHEWDIKTRGTIDDECGILFHFNIQDIKQIPSESELMLSNRIAPRQIIGLFIDETAGDEKKQKMTEITKALNVPLYEVYYENFSIDTVNGQVIQHENKLHKYSRDLLQRELENHRGIAQKRKSWGEMVEVCR